MIGGSGLTDIYLVNNLHQIVDPETLVPINMSTASGWQGAKRAIRIGKEYSRHEYLTQTDITIDDDGRLNVSWTQTKFDSAWNAFIKKVVSREAGAASAATEEVVDETGYKGGGAAAASTQDVLIVSYGAKDADGKIPVIYAVGNISKSSGGLSFQANTFAKPTLSFVSKACVNSEVGGLDLNASGKSFLDVYNSSTNSGGIIAAADATVVKLAKNLYYDMAFCERKV